MNAVPLAVAIYALALIVESKNFPYTKCNEYIRWSSVTIYVGLSDQSHAGSHHGEDGAHITLRIFPAINLSSSVD